MNEYADRIDARAFKRREQRERMTLWLFLAFIYLAGMVSGWAITVSTTAK